MKNWLWVFTSIGIISLQAQQMPETEIYLFDLSLKKGTFSISNPENITHHKGYDNQPFFSPDSALIYFATADENGRTDIATYNYRTKKTGRFTTTPEREYSPTVTPDGKFISCIIQRDNGAQDLIQYPVAGGQPRVIINTLTVGYHAWPGAESVFVFVLGDTTTLRKFSIADNKDTVVAKNIGRSLHRIPGTESISFVDKTSPDKWIIKKVHSSSGNLSVVAETLPGHEDMAWTNDGFIIMSDGEHLYSLDVKKKQPVWKMFKSSQDQKLKSISRIAVSTTGDKIAVVVNE